MITSNGGLRGAFQRLMTPPDELRTAGKLREVDADSPRAVSDSYTRRTACSPGLAGMASISST